jgi:hypothetical protein
MYKKIKFFYGTFEINQKNKLFSLLLLKLHSQIKGSMYIKNKRIITIYKIKGARKQRQKEISL